MANVKQRSTQIVKINIGNVKAKAIRRKRRQKTAAAAASKRELEEMKFTAYSRPYYGNADNGALAAALAGQSNFNNRFEQLENRTQLNELRRIQQQHDAQLAQLFQPNPQYMANQMAASSAFPQQMPQPQALSAFEQGGSEGWQAPEVEQVPEVEQEAAPAPISAPATQEPADDQPAAADAIPLAINNPSSLLAAIDNNDFDRALPYIRSISKSRFFKIVKDADKRRKLYNYYGVATNETLAKLYDKIIAI